MLVLEGRDGDVVAAAALRFVLGASAASVCLGLNAAGTGSGVINIALFPWLERCSS